MNAELANNPRADQESITKSGQLNGQKGKIDQLAMRTRPPRLPGIIHQRWEDLLFLHWPIDPKLLQPFLPSELDIDLFEGQAWIGITPFHLSGLRLLWLPSFPGLTSFEELNVRTYVRYKGTPGIWLFSLDCSKEPPAGAALLFLMLPYFEARIKFARTPPDFDFQLERNNSIEQFHARWSAGKTFQRPEPESLAFFLVERYCCFAQSAGTLQQIRFHHPPWFLSEASLHEYRSSMIQSIGLPEPAGPQLVHFARPVDVEIWAPAAVGGGS